MEIKNSTVVKENDLYHIISTEDHAILLDWRQEKLDLSDFKNGVTEFARQCKAHKASRAIIDAQKLDPNGDPVGWVSGQKKIEGEEEYNSWWFREIVPMYHEAAISVLSVATGNPNAPGELPPNTPPGLNFRIGYFVDLEAALQME